MVASRTSYSGRHPTTAALVVEVAHSSRRTDLGFKAVVYAAVGITDYWVVDLQCSEVVVHREPAGGGFGEVSRHRDGVVRALHHPRFALDVQALLR